MSNGRINNAVYTSLPLDKIVSDYRTGESLLKLANKHGVSCGVIRRMLASAGVATRRPSLRATAIVCEPGPPREVDPKHVYRTFTSTEDRLSQEEIARLRRAIGWNDTWTAPYDPIRGD